MKWNKEEEENLVELRWRGLGISLIAEELGRSRNSVKHKLKEYEPLIKTFKNSMEKVAEDFTRLNFARLGTEYRNRVRIVLRIAFKVQNELIQKVARPLESNVPLPKRECPKCWSTNIKRRKKVKLKTKDFAGFSKHTCYFICSDCGKRWHRKE